MATGQTSQASFDFCHNQHAASLLYGLQDLRSESLLVDVVLCVSGKEIPCHRPVLSACSGYFQGMFCYGHRESKAHKVDINGVGPNTLQLIVDYAYTSKVTITEGNAVNLLEAANFFQIHPVFDACAKFISEHLSVKNCLEMMCMGSMLSPELYEKALSCVMKEFTAISKRQEFLNLTKDELITIISSDDLNAQEETVYMAVMTWINHNTSKRQKEMRELMELVRFPLMDKMYFLDNVQSNEAVRKSCPDIVAETLKYQLFPENVQSPRTRPRDLKEAVVVVGGILGQGQDSVEFSNYLMMPCSSSWVPITKMKHSYDRGFAVAVLGSNDIFVCAGDSSNREVWLYQLELNLWSQLAPLNVPRNHHKLAVVHDKVYAIGGLDDRVNASGLKSVLAAVEVYDRCQNKWTECVPLPQPRYKHAVAVVNGSIYVMGGRDAENRDTSTVYRLSPWKIQWEPQSNMPERAADITTAVLNGAIYVAGLPNKLFSYSPGENGGCWSVVAITGYLLPRCGMTVSNGKVYIYGGLGSGLFGRSPDGQVLCHDPEAMTLKPVGQMHEALYGHACVTIVKAAHTRIPQVRLQSSGNQ
ncbi:kelch-like protein 24 isoform X2 [Branchiostoma floridae]|uniref:Kelch-like protein 24 isoform X1 n=1 Tax=Branchiostoma floridae TaxID=7739 RepID=A0A9J7M0C3_BRAFL|nr:kelch-like protein 24 isoform X1 [Branchiostoma floridae]XP_035692472.1 kelch-like protein 24 isoform X2 [Branchiostoma floridae]